MMLHVPVENKPIFLCKVHQVIFLLFSSLGNDFNIRQDAILKSKNYDHGYDIVIDGTLNIDGLIQGDCRPCIYSMSYGISICGQSESNSFVKIRGFEALLATVVGGFHEVEITFDCPHVHMSEAESFEEIVYDDLNVVEGSLEDYFNISDNVDKGIHEGALKILISAMAFFIDLKIKNINFSVVNVLGAAGSYQLCVLIQSMPKHIVWNLYDPDIVPVYAYDKLKWDGYNINYYPIAVDSFTEFDKDSVVLSDIRRNPSEECVKLDNELQFVISQKVKAMSIKFRLYFDDYIDDDLAIPIGKIFVQCYKKANSAEYRLFKFEDGFVNVNNRRLLNKHEFFKRVLRFSAPVCNDCLLAYKIYKLYFSYYEHHNGAYIYFRNMIDDKYMLRMSKYDNFLLK